MNATLKICGSMALCFGSIASAQQPAPPDAVTPGSSTVSAPSADSAAPKPTVPAKPAKATAQSEAGEPRADTSRAPSPARTPPAAGQKTPGATDRLDLGTATVTGDREQPKVMYIVPWKRSDIGDLAGKPMNSLVDEILAPVDRDVFKREVYYYKAVKSDASQNGAPPPPSPQGEK